MPGKYVPHVYTVLFTICYFERFIYFKLIFFRNSAAYTTRVFSACEGRGFQHETVVKINLLIFL